MMKKRLKKTIPETKNFGEIHSMFKNNGQTMDNGNFCKKQKPTNADIQAFVGMWCGDPYGN